MKNNRIFTQRRTPSAPGSTVAKVTTGARKKLLPCLIRDLFAAKRRCVAPPAAIPDPAQWDNSRITAAWLGHSTVLLNFYGLTILTDPVLFPRIGAHVKVGTIGPKRLVAPALTLDKLPAIDLILLSHAHFDHFDVPTLRHFPVATQVVTAQATAGLLRRTRLRLVNELSWGESVEIITRRGQVQVEAFEVNHWGARWRRDQHRGYNGYIISRNGQKLLFGGDTAMSRTFAPLRSKGPFAAAIMPIGSYNPWTVAHCTPEQAVEMANAAGARFFLPIHHKTFLLGKEGPDEPIERLQAALQQEPERVAWRNVGETFVLPA